MDMRDKVKWWLSPIWMPIFAVAFLAHILLMLFTLPMALFVWLKREPFEPESFWECWMNF